MELAAIRNGGSLLMQETISMELYYAKSAEELAQRLGRSGEAFESRRLEYMKAAVITLQKFLARKLNKAEREKILEGDYVSDVMRIIDNLAGAASSAREQLWTQFMRS